jgi:hypothetical protein
MMPLFATTLQFVVHLLRLRGRIELVPHGGLEWMVLNQLSMLRLFLCDGPHLPVGGDALEYFLDPVLKKRDHAVPHCGVEDLGCPRP